MPIGCKTRLDAGSRYNMLTVLEEDTSMNTGATWVRCRCDCGNITVLRAYDITSGKVKSCGCLWKELIRARATKVEYDRRSLTISEWSEETGISVEAIKGRLRRGWPIEVALTAPINTKFKAIGKPRRGSGRKKDKDTMVKGAMVAPILDLLGERDMNLRELYEATGAKQRNEKETVRRTLRRLQERDVVSKVGMTKTIHTVGIYHLIKDDERVKEE